MPRRKTLINKEAVKKLAGKCHFCDCADYALLDVHRIVEGQDGGKYTDFNTVTACANCHRKIHDGQIRIDRKFFSTAGKWVLHYWKEDQEYWD